MNFLKKKRTRVVLITAEAYPFDHNGTGPASVRVLPESLARLGFDVSLIAPKYRRPAIEELGLEQALEKFLVPLGTDKVAASVWTADASVAPATPAAAPIDPEPPARHFPVYFIENAKYFGRDRIFGSKSNPYPDNDERFAFFCRAALEFLRKSRLVADVLHCHDWPAALVPLLLRTQYPDRRPFKRTVSVLTIHDPAARGEFPPEALALTGLPWDFFTPDRLAHDGKFSFLKAGVLFADAVTAGDAASVEAVQAGTGRTEPASAPERRKSGERLEFTVPETAEDIAGIYRRALRSRGGDIHVG